MTMPRPLAGLLVAAGLLCGGCASGGGAASGTSAPPTSPTTTTTTTQGGDMRSALAAGLRDTSPVLSALVAKPTTTLAEAPLPGASGWKVVDITSPVPPHPQRAFVGLHESGRTVLLSGRPDGFASVTQGLEVADAGDAVTLATTYIDATRSMSTLGYRVEKPADVRWRPTLDAEQAKVRDAFLAEQGEQLAAPRAKAVDGGWTVTVWTITGSQLVRHDLTVRADGTVTDVTAVAADKLPVVIGL